MLKKEIRATNVIAYENELYTMVEHDEVKIGSIIWDSRIEGYSLIESEKDLSHLLFLAPELYYVFNKLPLRWQ